MIKTILVNARSLKTVNKRVNKLVQLQNIAGITDSEIIAVTETWLNENVSNGEILNDNYSIHRRDRNTGARGGGILLAVKNSLNSALDFSNKTEEMIGVSVTINKSNI